MMGMMWTVSVTTIDGTATEGNADPGQFKFTRSGGLPGMTLDIYYTVGGAVSAGDYLPPLSSPGIVTIGPFALEKTVTWNAGRDNYVESTESLIVTITPNVGYTVVGGPASAWIVDDPPIVRLTTTDDIAGEVGNNPGEFKLEREGGNTAAELHVPLSVHGSASPGADYSSLVTYGYYHFGVNETSVLLPVLPFNDVDLESPETVEVDVVPVPASYIIAAGSGTVTILDDDRLPEISVNDVTVVEGDPGDATTPIAPFELTLSWPSAAQVQVSFITADGSAVSPDDYGGITLSTYTFLPGFTSLFAPIAIVKDFLNEADENFFLNLSSPVNATLADPQGKATIIDDDGEVIDIDFVQLNDPGFGTLENNNPGMFEGGYRFFPDARAFASRDVPENYVRVRATVVGAQVGDWVWFRSFDVDDPTNDAGPVTLNEDLIDPNDGVAPNKVRTGRDNRGTLLSSNVPGETTNPAGEDGFQGLLRPVYEEGWTGQWLSNVALSHVQQGGIAEVDMATSFAAGDNFRVVASTVESAVMALNDTTDVPTTGTTPALSEFLGAGQGAVTEQLSVWRRIHIEQDRMERADGDFAIGSIVAGGTQNGSTALVPTNIDAEAGEYTGGLLEVAGGPPLPITGNTSGSNAVFSVTGTLPPEGAVIVYQDDYVVNPQGLAVTQVNTEIDANLYDLLQETPDQKKNRFADAYMQPELNTLDQFDSLIPALTHVPWTIDGFEQLVDSHRGTKPPGYETELFWVAYVSTAFEGPEENDNDPTGGETYMGGTTITNTISLVLMEATRDAVDTPPKYPHVPDLATGLARVTVHEVGHQFLSGGLPQGEHRDSPDNIMDTEPFDVAPGDYYFASEEVATYRMRVESP